MSDKEVSKAIERISFYHEHGGQLSKTDPRYHRRLENEAGELEEALAAEYGRRILGKLSAFVKGSW